MIFHFLVSTGLVELCHIELYSLPYFHRFLVSIKHSLNFFHLDKLLDQQFWVEVDFSVLRLFSCPVAKNTTEHKRIYETQTSFQNQGSCDTRVVEM